MDDLFSSGPRQMGLDFGDAPKPQSYEPDRDEIRAELNEILDQARNAMTGCPWDERGFKYHKTVFPQMANWLPEAERDQLRIAFAREIERIESLMEA